MNSRLIFFTAVLCGLLVVSIVTGGCTSSEGPAAGPDRGGSVSSDTSGISGTYTSLEDPANVFVLKSDGKVQFRNAAGGFSGTYTTEKDSIRICAEESDGTSCITAPMDADGSFVFGANTYKK